MRNWCNYLLVSHSNKQSCKVCLLKTEDEKSCGEAKIGQSIRWEMPPLLKILAREQSAKKSFQVNFFSCLTSPFSYNFNYNLSPINVYSQILFRFVQLGIKSRHSNYFEDRQWAFYCCDMGRRIKRCSDTEEVNYMDHALKFSIMPGYFLSGMSSHHNNYYE